MAPLISLLVLVVSFSLYNSFSSAMAAQINVWPKPTTVSWPSPVFAALSPSFRVVSPYTHHRHLNAAARRYTRLLLSERHRPLAQQQQPINFSAAPILSLFLSITDPFAPLHPGADESYSLSIPTAGGAANLTAATPWGAIRGLETLSQMSLSGAVPAGVAIHDRPLFPHRGLLLDTARNFYPVADILRTIRAMAHNKLNVFHWHLTDSQSFPLLLPSETDLALSGSYSPSMRYSPADVRRVVEYAMGYGVRVVPEIDAPGHAASWAGAHPDIVTCAGEFWNPPGAGGALAAEPGAGQLNPLVPKTYDVVKNVINDAGAMFPDQYYHAGADDVSPACWKRDPAVQSYLSSDNKTVDSLLELFIGTAHPFIVSHNRTVVYWEDVLLSAAVKVDPSVVPAETTILQTWNNGPNNTKRLTAAGYRVIVSSADFYYLDCGYGGWVGNDSRYDTQVADEPGKPFNYAGGNGGSWCGPFKTWQRVYDYDITYGLTTEEAGRVLGGEVALWSEQSDATVVDGRLWPRAAAAAEALWSGNRDERGKKRYGEATDRLNEWRYRMVGRGIRAEPIQPLWCAMKPGMCNLVQ